MRVAVVDLDDTLVLGGRISCFLWSATLFFQRLGRKFQHPNSNLLKELRVYDKIIVLTSRDLKDTRLTEQQLRRAGIHFDRLISCPRKEVLTEWKTRMIQKLAEDSELDWIDDIFEEGFAPDVRVDLVPKVRTLRPDYLTKAKLSEKHDGGLEHV